MKDYIKLLILILTVYGIQLIMTFYLMYRYMLLIGG